MLKENKLKVILSSVVVLLPAVFGLMVWNELPDMITTHWGADGTADGFSGRPFAVFGLPFMLLAVHLICLFLVAKDEKQKNQSKKALNIIFWIIPVISLFSNGIIYAIAFGKSFDFIQLIAALLGILFVFIGNYLPKIRQNRIMGIRVSWTLNNEENWNKTHRLGGKVWVVCGLVMLFSVFLSETAMVTVMILAVFMAIVIPVGYSYLIYKKHRKEGVSYESKAGKTGGRIAAVLICVLLVGVAVFMFTGSIKVQLEDTSFTIEATYWDDAEVDYADIDSLGYRDNFDRGIRTNGFGSPRLAMGTFQNDEFGSYTLYAYTRAQEYIVLNSGENKLVIGLKTAEDTRKLYETLLAKLDE